MISINNFFILKETPYISPSKPNSPQTYNINRVPKRMRGSSQSKLKLLILLIIIKFWIDLFLVLSVKNNIIMQNIEYPKKNSS